MKIKHVNIAFEHAKYLVNILGSVQTTLMYNLKVPFHFRSNNKEGKAKIKP